MSIEKETQHWSVAHFILFLYLRICYADFKLEFDELQMLEKQFTKSHPEVENFNEIFEEVDDKFQNLNDAESEEFIRSFLKRLNLGIEDRQRIKQEIRELVAADNVVTFSERDLVIKIEALLA
jgi:hypothetical protein